MKTKGFLFPVLFAFLGFSTRLDIPETIDGVPVTAIGEEAFKLHSCLSYVTLPEGVTEVQLGENAITIGQSAFAGNPLQLLVIPANQPVGYHILCGNL